MGLSKYYQKRDFEKTAEPKGREHAHHDHGGRFVIQKHDASRLHYDFRLEMEGVLRSWAVPKGPSLDPADKRLAVQVEDHPIEYGTFEGIIPAGEYGGGTVMLWDHGTWKPEGEGDAVKAWKKGRLKIVLKGEKLKGGWNLVRIGGSGNEDGKNWLLIKERDGSEKSTDEYNVTEKLDRSVTTGRSLDEIAEGAASSKKGGKGGLNVWHSNRSESSGKPAAGKKTVTAKKASAARKPGAAELDPNSVAGAKKMAMPEFFKPQLATLVKTAPTGDQWVHEIKFDGYRALCFLRKAKVELITRNGNDWTDRFSPVAEACRTLAADQAILDGEVVLPGANGATDFQALQNALSSGRQKELIYYAFDLLYLNGYDLRGATLMDRKELLRQLLEASGDAADRIKFSDHFEDDGRKVLESACNMRLEGIISKQRNGRYASARTESWVKTKCIQRQEFVIGGFTDPEGARSHFGALLVGIPQGKASKPADLKLKYAGKVGTGFTQKSLEELWERLKPLEVEAPAFVDVPKGYKARNMHWVKPLLVGEVEFAEFTEDGHLRHPSFQGLREDKAPQEIVAEVPKKAVGRKGTEATEGTKGSKALKSGGAKTVKAKTTAEPKKAAPARKAAKAKTAKIGDDTEALVVQGIAISNPGRLLYPEQGITKQELIEYYDAVSKYMLPLIQHRPITLVRCPAGRGKPCFYQRHSRDEIPAGLEPVHTTEKGEPNIYLAVEKSAGLISLAQMGTLEIHVWNSCTKDLERPDQFVLDLDPDPEAGWEATVKAARRLKDFMEKLGFVPFLKTTGGKGLHVVVPLKPSASWDELRQFTEAVAVAMVQQYPDEYVATMSKAKRKGKVFIDYLRNVREASAIAPYSTRAREGAPVSVPIAWAELKASLDPQKFTVRTVPGRLKKMKQDPWKDFWKSRKPLKLNALEEKLI